MTSQLVLSLLLTTATATAGLLTANKVKGISREWKATVAMAATLGFVAFLLTLINRQVLPDLWFADDLIIGFAYGYFMADAKIWENTRP